MRVRARAAADGDRLRRDCSCCLRSLVRSAFPRPSSKPCSVRPLRAHNVSLKGQRGGYAHEGMTFSLHHCPGCVEKVMSKNLRTENDADAKKVHWHLVRSAFWPRKIDRLSSNLPRQRNFPCLVPPFPHFVVPLISFLVCLPAGYEVAHYFGPWEEAFKAEPSASHN